MLVSPVVTPSYPPMLDASASPGRAMSTKAVTEAQRPSEADDSRTQGRTEPAERPATVDTPTKPNGEALSEAELHEVKQLERIDQETRAHEKAHQITGGPYAGSPSYEYQREPDGEQYAVAGEVPIDYGEVKGDPQATIEKMQQVIAAALAPTEPSTKDHQVAAQARQKLLTAQLELAQQRGEMVRARLGEQPSRTAPHEWPAVA